MSNEVSFVNIVTMKNKAIIAILVVLIGICIGVGFVQAKSSSNEGKNQIASSTLIVTTESSTQLDQTTKTKKSETTNKTITGNSTTNKNTTKKVETTAKTSATKSSTKKETTSKKKSSSTTRATTKSKSSFDVKISINCKNALKYKDNIPEYFLRNETYTAKDGDNVYDALKSVCSKNGISLNVKGSYIAGIGGLNEKDCTPSSGWMYRVNGVAPNYPAKGYTLSKGDVVEWYYVTSNSDN